MVDLTGAERVVVDAWIPAAILTAAAQLEAISVGLSTRVYEGVAPLSAKYPYIVFQSQSDPTDVRGVGVVTVMVQATYLVKVIAATDYPSIGQIVSIINSVLVTSTGATPSVGGRILSSVKNTGFSLNEIYDGVQLRNLGAVYGIFVQGLA